MSSSKLTRHHETEKGQLAIVAWNSFSFVHWIVYFSIFTISFDIFLVINLGFNFRISQLLLIPVIIYVLATRLNARNSIVPLGYGLLLAWTLFIILFVQNSLFPTRSIGYVFWLVFNVLTIFCVVQLFQSEQRLLQLLKCYIYSFVFVSFFGLIQFIFPLLRLSAPLVQQWWIPGVLARINGFSYEPSFFATYLLIGWVFVACLCKDNAYIINKKVLYFFYFLLTLVMFLSSSRMGWLIMLIWYMQYPILFVAKLFQGRLNIRLMKYALLFTTISIFFICIVVYIIGFDTISFLFSGLGIAGGASHSSDTRTHEFMDTLTIFMKSPIIGYSLGGISSAIGELRGIDVSDLEVAKMNEGMSVFAEVLAASGIVGGLFFVLYFIKLLCFPIKLMKAFNHQLYRPLLKALVIALIFELIILQFNQNILRPYLWMHIAILCCVYSVAQTSYRKQKTHDY